LFVIQMSISFFIEMDTVYQDSESRKLSVDTLYIPTMVIL